MAQLWDIWRKLLKFCEFLSMPEEDWNERRVGPTNKAAGSINLRWKQNLGIGVHAGLGHAHL